VLDHVQRLRALAERLTETYLRTTQPDAVLLGGSAVTGGADEHSDVDLLLYYAELPSDEALEAARRELGGRDRRWIAPRSDEGAIEQFLVDGVNCQLGHLAIAGVEAEIRRVTVEHDTDPYALKAIGGLHEGLALHGAGRIEGWRSAAAYDEALQRAVVAEHWQVFPLWRLHDHVAARDALLWRQQILVDAAFDLVAVLAAANRVWFSSFQFKRTRRLVGRLEAAPPELAARLESLFTLEPRAAADELERLVRETEQILAARGLLPETV
jgi:hypothetical protein